MQSASVPICSTVEVVSPSRPTQYAEYVVCGPQVTDGCVHDADTLVKLPGAPATAYPAQLVLVPARSRMLGAWTGALVLTLPAPRPSPAAHSAVSPAASFAHFMSSPIDSHPPLPSPGRYPKPRLRRRRLPVVRARHPSGSAVHAVGRWLRTARRTNRETHVPAASAERVAAL